MIACPSSWVGRYTSATARLHHSSLPVEQANALHVIIMCIWGYMNCKTTRRVIYCFMIYYRKKLFEEFQRRYKQLAYPFLDGLTWDHMEVFVLRGKSRSLFFLSIWTYQFVPNLHHVLTGNQTFTRAITILEFLEVLCRPTITLHRFDLGYFTKFPTWPTTASEMRRYAVWHLDDEGDQMLDGGPNAIQSSIMRV